MLHMQKFNEKEKKLFHIFVDLEKVFNKVPRRAIRWALRRQKVPEKLVNADMSLYVKSRSTMKAMVGISHDFDI